MISTTRQHFDTHADADTCLFFLTHFLPNNCVQWYLNLLVYPLYWFCLTFLIFQAKLLLDVDQLKYVWILTHVSAHYVGNIVYDQFDTANGKHTLCKSLETKQLHVGMISPLINS